MVFTSLSQICRLNTDLHHEPTYLLFLWRKAVIPGVFSQNDNSHCCFRQHSICMIPFKKLNLLNLLLSAVILSVMIDYFVLKWIFPSLIKTLCLHFSVNYLFFPHFLTSLTSFSHWFLMLTLCYFSFLPFLWSLQTLAYTDNLWKRHVYFETQHVTFKVQK